jgi:uncharacterized membrane protein
MTGDIRHGLIAGAAGITALRTVTYLDMAPRGRPASRRPERTVGERRQPGPVPTRSSRHTGRLLLRSGALGFAAGARSTMGVAGALLASQRRSERPVHRLRLGALTAVSLAVCAELVVDKLPVTPSRLQAPSLVVRVASGSGGGAALARQAHARVTMSALVGAVGAVAGSLVGAAWRDAAAARMPPWSTALVEDAAALLLTAAAALPDRHDPSHAPPTG